MKPFQRLQIDSDALFFLVITLLSLSPLEDALEVFFNLDGHRPDGLGDVFHRQSGNFYFIYVDSSRHGRLGIYFAS